MTPSTEGERAAARTAKGLPQVDAVVIGGSAGAIVVLLSVVETLPADFRLPIVVVVHRLKSAPSHLAEVLRARCALPVSEARHGEPLLPGHVFVAPPDHHLRIDARQRLVLDTESPVHFSRPSIDVLFESAALALGARVAGVLLTGGNEDGAAGLHAISRAGGVTLVQSPHTAEVPHMPEAALARFKPTGVLVPGELGPALNSLGAAS